MRQYIETVHFLPSFSTRALDEQECWAFASLSAPAQLQLLATHLAVLLYV
jgi:hypothetical protein